MMHPNAILWYLSLLPFYDWIPSFDFLYIFVRIVFYAFSQICKKKVTIFKNTTLLLIHQICSRAYPHFFLAWIHHNLTNFVIVFNYVYVTFLYNISVFAKILWTISLVAKDYFHLFYKLVIELWGQLTWLQIMSDLCWSLLFK